MIALWVAKGVAGYTQTPAGKCGVDFLSTVADKLVREAAARPPVPFPVSCRHV